MNIESLKYFLSVEKNSSFSIAADELCISQSSLSKHIKKLELELNCILFERHARYVSLTPAGSTLKSYAINIVNNYHNLILDLNEFTVSIPKISIGYIPVINQYNIATHIGSFKTKFKDLQLDFHEGEHEEILTMLLNRKIDFAILRSNTLNSFNLDITPLAQDELVLITSKTHPIANKKYVSLTSLSEENFISLGKNSGIYTFFTTECEKKGFTPNVICYNSRIENILGFVAAGMGISPLMKRTVACFDKKNLSTVLLKERITSNLCLVHLSDKKLTPIENNFKNHLISTTSV